MCFYCDCITSGPAVLIGLDVLRNRERESNETRSFPFCAEQLPHLVLSIILGFHALTGCNTLLPLSGKGKDTCWKMFFKYAHILTGIVRDDNVDDAWAFVCSLWRKGYQMY